MKFRKKLGVTTLTIFFMQSLGISGVTNAVSPPSVVLVTPGENKTVISSTVDFSCSATDDIGLLSATLYYGKDIQTLKSFIKDGQTINETDDTYISADTPDTNYGSGVDVNIDGQTPHAHGLIKFPDVFGSSPGQVPLGAQISSASIEVECFNPGNTMTAYLLTEDWNENEATWNQRFSGISWTNPGADGTGSHLPSGISWSCASAGKKTLDITNFAQAWADGTPNYGVVVKDGGTDGVDFYTSENSTTSNRPIMNISYQTLEGWGPRQTVALSGTEDTANFTATLDDQSTYDWNCEIEDTDNQKNFAPADFSVTVDSTWTPPQSTAENLKVAFIGDVGVTVNSQAVMDLIVNEGAEALLVQGDFDYLDDPTAWENLLNTHLGPDFPVFASVGNHDTIAWSAYQQNMINRINNIPAADCTGDIGVQNTCHYKGLFMVFTAPGIFGSGHDGYIRDELAADNSVWSVCSWHKNMRLMQVGGKGDETGWGVYEECRIGGGIIATGHEHSYSRTHLLDSMQTQSIASTSTTMTMEKGKTFAFVSGLGGQSIRAQSLSGDWWASVYTSTQGANYGALFCTFNPDGQKDHANCYFKDIDGNIADSFTLISAVENIGNIAPIANAGEDQTVFDDDNDGGEEITLEGSGSSDADGTIESYEWSTGGVLLGTGAIIGPLFLSSGSHTIDLVVADNEGATSTDSVLITVNPNQTPTAFAGPDQIIDDNDDDGFEPVTLDASGSTDSDGSIVSYEWAQGTAPLGTTSLINTVLPVGTHLIDLTVTDNGGSQQTDQVVITINEHINALPIAAAGADQEIFDVDENGTENVTLDGSGSTDSDGTIVSYQWSEGAVVLGTTEILSLDLAIGTHIIDLLVTDNDGATDTDQVAIIVSQVPNIPPVADAGTDQNVSDADGDGSVSITLDGSGSTDPDGTIVSYEWSELGQLLGSGEFFALSFDVGTHTVDLLVTDNDGTTDTDSVVITVANNVNPTASAGVDQTVADTDGDGSEPVVLDASGSTDSDGTIVSYEWLEGAVSLGFGEILPTTLSVGIHSLTLKVTDNGGKVGFDGILVTVESGTTTTSTTLDIVSGYSSGTQSDITASDVTVSDNVYHMVQNRSYTSFSFESLGIPDGAVIDSLVLHVEHYEDNGFNGTVGWEVGEGWPSSPTVYGSTAAPLAVGSGSETTHSWDVTALVDTADINTLEFRIINNDTKKRVRVDHIYADITFTSGPLPNQNPTADAGTDQIISDADLNGAESITLDGSGSTDSDGTIVSYEWAEGAVILGSTAVLTTDFTVGIHTVILTVTDNEGATDSDSVLITVTDPQSTASLHVADISLSNMVTQKGPNTFCTVTALVSVQDQYGMPTESVIVDATWGGVAGGADAGTSDTSGVATLVSSQIKNCGIFTLTVDNLTLTNYTYDSASNIETSDSIITP